MGIHYRHMIGVLAVFLGCMLASDAAVAETETSPAEFAVADEWVHAATDRQAAGMAQQREAEELAEIAQELRKKGYLDDLERRANLNRAGEMEFKAGDLQFLASANYEKAAANWTQAAREYKRIREREKEREATGLSGAAATRSLDALEASAEEFELASESYSADNGADNVKAGLAAERAAQCRETLAVKRPVVKPASGF